MSEREFDPYGVVFNGVKLDPYRVADAFQITHPALAQALKKLLRCGAKHKTAEEDVREVMSSCQRFLDMKAEESAFSGQPSLFDTPLACPHCEAARSQAHALDCPRYTCPVCDGGPGNDNTCACPRQ